MSNDPTMTVEPPEATVVPLPGTPPPVKPASLISSLTAFGAVAGALIVVVFSWTKPNIDRNKAQALQDAAKEVLAEPAAIRTVFVYKGQLVDSLPAGVDSAGLDRVYLGTDEQGNAKGFAITAGEPGFADVINLIFGYEPGTGKILGMKVIEEKETPGLGDKIEKDSLFVNGFEGALSPIKGVKRGTAHADKSQVDMITGATISSRAVINIINHRLEKVGPLLKGYRQGGGS